MIELHQQQCVACRLGEPALTLKEAEELNKQIPDWEVLDESGILKLRREYCFESFVKLMSLFKKSWCVTGTTVSVCAFLKSS